MVSQFPNSSQSRLDFSTSRSSDSLCSGYSHLAYSLDWPLSRAPKLVVMKADIPVTSASKMSVLSRRV